MAKRTPEQNREIYLRRKQRAIAEGYSGYGQKRHKLEREHKKLTEHKSTLDKLREQFPGLVEAYDMDLPPDRQRAYDWLTTNGNLTQEEMQNLRTNPENFWQLARPLFDRESP